MKFYIFKPDKNLFWGGFRAVFGQGTFRIRNMGEVLLRKMGSMNR